MRSALLLLKSSHLSTQSHLVLPHLRHLARVPLQEAQLLRASLINCVAELMCDSYENASSPFNILRNKIS